MSMTYICEVCAKKDSCPSAFEGLTGITKCEHFEKVLTTDEQVQIAFTAFANATVKRMTFLEKKIENLETGMVNLSTYTNKVIETLRKTFDL